MLFYRTAVMKPFVIPANVPNLNKLDKYLNMNPTDKMLLKAYISYTLAHPKIASTSFPILVLTGGQGSGKTSTTENIILPLIDPNIVGVQAFPKGLNDLMIPAQNAHVLAFDNIRYIKPNMADGMCIASTGGTVSQRKLYTTDTQNINYLHCAIILNGIHQFMNQPDLAQRAIQIAMYVLDGQTRQSEKRLIADLEKDMPEIFSGILCLIAGILKYLPEVTPENPERMYDFSHWLAAYERVDGYPEGTYQAVYSANVKEAQLDTLLTNVLADAVYKFAKYGISGSWSGTPSTLLEKLGKYVDEKVLRNREWPNNAISMSKRLTSLQGSLRSQGITIEFSRGKDRMITIIDEEAY